MNIKYILLGGTASVYVGQPLDTVKVKMQTFPSMHRNALKCFVQTFKQDGIWKGLYAGINKLFLIVGLATKVAISRKCLLESYELTRSYLSLRIDYPIDLYCVPFLHQCNFTMHRPMQRNFDNLYFGDTRKCVGVSDQDEQ